MNTQPSELALKITALFYGGIHEPLRTQLVQQVAHHVDELLKELREDAENGGGWFNAFQEVEEYLLNRDLWDEENIDPATSPAHTLIRGLERNLKPLQEDKAFLDWADRHKILTSEGMILKLPHKGHDIRAAIREAMKES